MPFYMIADAFVPSRCIQQRYQCGILVFRWVVSRFDGISVVKSGYFGFLKKNV